LTTFDIFDCKLSLPDSPLSAKEKKLLGFEVRYNNVHDQLRLLLNLDELNGWSKKFYNKQLAICDLIADQYPFVIFHGDVGTGKTATAECIANRLIKEAHIEDSLLFKLSNRVRGSGKVGEMSTLLTQAFSEVKKSVGKTRRAILIIDEGDSLASARSQEHSHHEDKVAVNTLIQCIDELRAFGGRVLVILCTNRLTIVDAALQRRAAMVELFKRPDDNERRALLKMDLDGLTLTDPQIEDLVKITAPKQNKPGWTFSDIRTRLYPKAIAKAFPEQKLTFQHLFDSAMSIEPSPIMEDK